MELVLLTLVLSGILVGTVGGIHYRRAKIRQIRSLQTNIPAYQLEHHLSPVEFAIICEGILTKQAVVAQLVAFIMAGHLAVERSSKGALTIRRIAHRTSTSSNDAALLRHFIPINQTEATFFGGNDLKSAMTYEAIKSLRQKGWLNNKVDQSEKATVSGLAITTIAITFLVGGTGIAMISFNTNRSLLFENIAILMMLFAVMVLIFMIIRYTFIYNAQKTFRSQSSIIRSITPRFTQEYHTVYDVYTYLKVSGLDTMTPDYSALDFKGLDPLYPYAVAVGLDPKIIHSLK